MKFNIKTKGETSERSLPPLYKRVMHSEIVEIDLTEGGKNEERSHYKLPRN